MLRDRKRGLQCKALLKTDADGKNAEISRDLKELHGVPQEEGTGGVLYKHSEN